MLAKRVYADRARAAAETDGNEMAQERGSVLGEVPKKVLQSQSDFSLETFSLRIFFFRSLLIGTTNITARKPTR